MTAKPVTITTFTASDLPDVALLHVESWQQAYTGHVDQHYLDTLDPAQRLSMWQGLLSKSDDPRFGLLVARDGGRLAGFLSYGPPNSEDGDIRIGALYLHRDYWAQGIGFKLFKTAQKAFQKAGFIRPYLWVLDSNSRAIEAYRRWGGAIDESKLKTDKIGSQTVREFCVVFPLQQPI